MRVTELHSVVATVARCGPAYIQQGGKVDALGVFLFPGQFLVTGDPAIHRNLRSLFAFGGAADRCAKKRAILCWRTDGGPPCRSDL